MDVLPACVFRVVKICRCHIMIYRLKSTIFAAR